MLLPIIVPLMFVLPLAVTLLLRPRWLPVWIGLLALFVLWLCSQPLDGPAAAIGLAILFIVSTSVAVVIIIGLVRIAVHRNRVS
jgi:hypothetical protein